MPELFAAFGDSFGGKVVIACIAALVGFVFALLIDGIKAKRDAREREAEGRKAAAVYRSQLSDLRATLEAIDGDWVSSSHVELQTPSPELLRHLDDTAIHAVDSVQACVGSVLIRIELHEHDHRHAPDTP